MVLLIFSVTALLSLAMMAAWVLQRRLGNAGWVDVVWSFGLGAACIAYALAPEPGIAWPGPRQLLLATLAAAWSLRLGCYLLIRTRRHAEDARYAQLRRDWAARFEGRLFLFLQIQAAAAALLALSVLAAAANPAGLNFFDLFGLALFGGAVAGAGIADAQLHRFRADPAQRGQICDIGLWRLSRHPNYFFEWLVWLAYPCFALGPDGGNGFGWLALLGPALMYWLLVHVSGIPPLERHMLRSRGEAYRRYQARTPAFLPFPLASSR
jgi:steroid 5-alpha reductase family enzyme